MTNYKLDWLADALRGAGLPVVEVAGWKTRGRAEFGTLRGVMCHHTAGPRQGDKPSLRICIDGDATLAGPRCHLFLTRAGVWHVVAAGKANHAGKGRWNGRTDMGNSEMIGVEAENTGLDNDQPWPEAQMESYARGCAALVKRGKLTAADVIGHKEYAPGRKIDPTFDMPAFRARVAALAT